MGISSTEKVKACTQIDTDTHTHFCPHSPRLVPAPHYGRWFPLPTLIKHRVHKLKDVRRTKLERGP